MKVNNPYWMSSPQLERVLGVGDRGTAGARCLAS